MQNNFLQLDNSKVRKWWLWLFIFSIFLTTITMIQSIPELKETIQIVGYFISFAVSLLYFFALYYFGYRKSGTKFLTFSITMFCINYSFISLVIILHFISSNHFSIIQILYNGLLSQFVQFGIVFTSISYLANLAFWYLTIRLRRINKQLKNKTV